MVTFLDLHYCKKCNLKKLFMLMSRSPPFCPVKSSVIFNTFIHISSSLQLLLITTILILPNCYKGKNLLSFHQNQCWANTLKMHKSWIMNWNPPLFQLPRKIYPRHKDFIHKTDITPVKTSGHGMWLVFGKSSCCFISHENFNTFEVAL